MIANVGDKILYLDEYEGWVIHQDRGTQNTLVFFPDFLEKRLGHNEWQYHTNTMELLNIPIPKDKTINAGSYWASPSGISILSKCDNPKIKYLAVINKIKAMDKHRKELGYAF